MSSKQNKTLFSSETFKLRVIGFDGSVVLIDVHQDLSIITLKSMALSHFFNPVEKTKRLMNIKLVLVSTGMDLNPDNSVHQEGLTNDDEVLLVEHHVVEMRETEKNQKAPTQKEVLVATENLTPKNIRKMPGPVGCTDDFPTEHRKILITLIRVAVQLLLARPDANEVFTMIVNKLDTRDKIIPERNGVKNLVDMGFPEQRVKFALMLKRNNQVEALEWLLDKVTSDVDLTMTTEDSNLTSDGGSSSNPVEQSLEKLLASFRAFRQMEFKPKLNYVEHLTGMGFTETEVVEALRVTENNKSAACEYLLGERNQSLFDTDAGLDPEGPIYKALLTNPTIQLGLNNTVILFVLLSILENPSATNAWLDDADNDVTRVLSQIFKTYHEEKHILTVNNFIEMCNKS